VPILVGGTSAAAMRRVATWGAGWTMGGGDADAAKQGVDHVRRVWDEAGREGEPRLAALAYFALGDEAKSDSFVYLRTHYGFTGDYAQVIADSALRSTTAISDAAKRFEDSGITELFFDPTTTTLDQVDRLADLLL
jgi:alkanesulfonate monooxygenase SsuD/methylene tetrahydromethanopterin reductase-like flavin-dependent oxidoreductase (luciferase family)